jgi:hypothetical protein
MGAAVVLGVGALRLDACGVVDHIELLKLHHARKGERDRPEPHRNLAPVGLVIYDFGELDAGDAGCDVPDVRHDRSGFGGKTAVHRRNCRIHLSIRVMVGFHHGLHCSLAARLARSRAKSG